jgi:hypothetical protein
MDVRTARPGSATATVMLSAIRVTTAITTIATATTSTCYYCVTRRQTPLHHAVTTIALSDDLRVMHKFETFTSATF